MVRVALKRMRCTALLAMLALLVGAGSALAQSDAAASVPYPIEPGIGHKAKDTVHRAPAAKRETAKRPAVRPAAAKIPLPQAAPRAAMNKAAPPESEKARTAKTAPVKPKAQKAAAAKSDTVKPPASSTAFAGIPAADRLKIQQELFWSGDYSGAAGSEDSLEAAVKKFQKRNRAKITGALTDAQRAELIAAADRHAQEFGWRVVVDPATGIRIGLPTKLVPAAHDAAHGTRWSSPHGAVQVETFRYRHANLTALYEQERKNPATRKVDHGMLNDDNFFISGMQGLKYFSVRAKERGGEVRGFTLLYDQMMAGIVAPVMVAMATAFSPFPEQPAPYAALDSKVEYGTGLIVSADGHIVTARKVAQDCQVIVADDLGNAERVAEDKESGLALLRVYGASSLPAISLAPVADDKSGDITLVGIPGPKQEDGLKKLTAIKARLVDGTAIQLSQPMPVAGFSGAAALDGQGHFLGMMETGNFVLASADPGVPPVRMVPAAAIHDFLVRNHVADGNGGDARAAAIRIICVRK
jgi:Trypsin-like peptidase domain